MSDLEKIQKLPKIQIQKGRYLGMSGGNDVYDCDSYSVKDVEKYKKVAEKLAKEYKKLKAKYTKLIIKNKE